MSPSTPIRLVALDLDGTLLDSQSQISPRTRQAIADAVGHGVIVLPCTGRPLASLPPLVAQLPGIRYAITTNGAAVWDMGTDPLGAVYSRYADAARRQTHQPVRLLHRPMPPETAREAFALYQEYHGPLSIFSDGCAYLDAPGMELFQARKNRHLSTEARQPDDGRPGDAHQQVQRMYAGQPRRKRLCKALAQMQELFRGVKAGRKAYRLARYALGDTYDDATILKWEKTFYRRYFAQQFKRSCLPDGPKVGSAAVSPRGDLRMPSDACATLWLRELEEL